MMYENSIRINLWGGRNDFHDNVLIFTTNKIPFHFIDKTSYHYSLFNHMKNHHCNIALSIYLTMIFAISYAQNMIRKFCYNFAHSVFILIYYYLPSYNIESSESSKESEKFPACHPSYNIELCMTQ